MLQLIAPPSYIRHSLRQRISFTKTKTIFTFAMYFRFYTLRRSTCTLHSIVVGTYGRRSIGFFFFHLVDACNCELHLASRKNHILKCSICMRVASIQIIIINCNFISLYATLCIYSCIDDASNTSYIVCLPNTKTKKNKIKSNLH